MREIKFRAWDKEKKEMFEVEEIDFKHKTLKVKGENDWRNFPDLCELMECTGLSDKNGVEAFEGDLIMRPIMRFDRKKEYYQVLRDIPFWLIRSDESVELLEMNSISEVVGNIYANPELIKGQT